MTQAAQQWIPVSERLPEKENTRYLVMVGEPYGKYSWPDVAVFMPVKRRKKAWKWYMEPAGINPIVAGITHWMPLPEPPK